MTSVLIAVSVIPLVAGAICYLAGRRLQRVVSIAAAASTFGLVMALLPSASAGHVVHAGALLRLGPLSEIFAGTSALVYLLGIVHSVGYVPRRDDREEMRRYDRRYFCGYHLFAWALILVPVLSSLAFVWIAIEATTVVSALLVAIERNDRALEAAWKYLLLAEMGLGVGLVAILFCYHAASFAGVHDGLLPIGALLSHADRFSPETIQIAFVLAVFGFGTKIGLVPLHWWLPDAHSEAPTSVSALLSGALLATSLYVVFRFAQITRPAGGAWFVHDVLLAFGVASLAFAAVVVLVSRDIKRLLAYSSIEQMGIIVIGASFASPLALAGVLLQVIAHGAAKSGAFFGAGSFMRKYGTKDLAKMAGGLTLLPWSGPAFVLALLALGGFPPFAIFRSEMSIVAGGLRSGEDAAAVVLVALASVAFLGLTLAIVRSAIAPTTGAMAQPFTGEGAGPPGAAGGTRQGAGSGAVGPGSGGLLRGEPSWWMLAALLASLLVLVVLGVHPPAMVSHLLARAAANLGGRR